MKKILAILACLVLALPAATGQTAQGTQKINKKNLVVKEWNTNGKGAAKTLDHVTTWSADGKKIEEIEYDADGHQKWRKRYEWGENGRLARELVYDEHNKLDNYKTFEYNEFGKKKVQYTYSPKGKLKNTKMYEYLTQE